MRPIASGSFRWIARAGLTFVLAVAVSGILASREARAQGRDYFLSIDLPIQYIFTGNISGTSTPSGIKAMLHLPWSFSVGIESYTVEANDTQVNINTELDVQLIDLMISFELGPIQTGLGFGFGTIAMQPFQVTGTTFSMDDADATQLFLTLGWMTGQNWEFHIGYHQVEAESPLVVNGVPTSANLDLGGIMHSAGFTYWW